MKKPKGAEKDLGSRLDRCLYIPRTRSIRGESRLESKLEISDGSIRPSETPSVEKIDEICPYCKFEGQFRKHDFGFCPQEFLDTFAASENKLAGIEDIVFIANERTNRAIQTEREKIIKEISNEVKNRVSDLKKTGDSINDEHIRTIFFNCANELRCFWVKLELRLLLSLDDKKELSTGSEKDELGVRRDEKTKQSGDCEQTTENSITAPNRKEFALPSRNSAEKSCAEDYEK